MTALCILAALAPGWSGATSHNERFREQQIAQGRRAYARDCANCHGPELEGRAGTALNGVTFARTWGDGRHHLQDFYDVIARQMPKGAPGSLSDSENRALVAFIVARNGIVLNARVESTSLSQILPAAPIADPPPPPRSGRTFPEPPLTVGESTGHMPDDAELLDVKAGDWLTYNRTLAGDRYSPLGQISTANARQLRVRCIRPLGEIGSFETSPVAYQGRLYLTTVHKVFAIDGSNCTVLWEYDWKPQDAEHLPGNRGVALYRGKLYRGTADGHLIALDAETKALLWDVRVADSALGYEITGAPVAFEGKVFIGDAGADVGIKGRVYAFDAATGALVWAFNMIPAAGQPGAETWGTSTEHGGAATWSSMAIDPAARLVLVPTGNPAPDFYDQGRPGANLYTDSVVALSLDTGHLSWYVQQVPHDVHDWDTAAAPALFTQDKRRYMAVASKNGLLYLYDQDTRQVLAQTPFTRRENVDVPLSAGEGVHVCPGALGQYNGPAYSPALKRLFVASAERCNQIKVAPPRYIPGSVYFGGSFQLDPRDKQSGWIKAFDAADGREIWSVHRKDIVQAAVTPTAGGLLLTGDAGGHLLVLDAASGAILYEFSTGAPIAAGITTYLAGKEQLIAVPTGSSSRDGASASAMATLMVFAVADGP